MNRKVAASVTIVGIILAGTVYVLRDTPPTPEELTEQLVALAEKGDDAGFARLLEKSAERNMNGPIGIKGVVQDDAGSPLSGVTVRFRTTHLAMNAANASSERGEFTFDGEFELQCDSCSAIEADFGKEGFHSTDREWVAFGPGVRTPQVVDLDAVVILQAKGTPARLEPFRGVLEVGERTRVLPLSFGYGSGVMSPERVAERAMAENVTEPLYLRLVVDTEPDGTIGIDKVPQPGASYTIDRPRNPRLDFATANGGVIAYEPQESYVRLIDREMSLAPSSGYVSTVDLMRRDGTPQYFFCRIGDRHGRGKVNAAGLSGSAERPPTAEVSVSFELNVAPGDRNLTPRH